MTETAPTSRHSESHTLSDGLCYCTCDDCTDENGACTCSQCQSRTEHPHADTPS